MLYQLDHINLRQKLSDIQKIPSNSSTKILLIQGLIHEIRSKYPFLNTSSQCSTQSQKLLQISETNYTENIGPFSRLTQTFQTTQQLQQKIIQHQKLKIDLNEQIELHQDDLFQLEKVIQSKKQYQKKLDKKIFELQNKIQTQSKQKNCKTQNNQQCKLPLSARIKNFFM